MRAGVVWRWIRMWLAVSLLVMLSSLASATTLTSVSPNQGPPGTVVTFNGSGFTGTFDVGFDAWLAASYSVVNDTTLTATVPAGPPLGMPLDVYVDTPTGFAFLPFAFTVTATPPPPTAGAVSATVGYGSSNNPITLSLGGGAAASVAVGTPATHGTAIASGTTMTYTPQAGYAGPDSFTYTATNAGGTSAPATVTITVSPTTISYAPASPSGGTVGAAYSQSLVSASGGNAPYTYAIASGAVPAGLSLAGNGTLSGTPTAGGTFNFTVRATDSSTGAGPFSATSPSLSLTIAAPTIAVSPTTVPNAAAGTAYSQTVTASGGTASYAFDISAGALPAGLTLSAAGVLSGTPTVSGLFNFTVRAKDSSTGTGPYTGTRSYAMTVAAPTITIAPATVSNGGVAAAYNQTIVASGGFGSYSYAVTAGALPAGLSVSSGGAISGTPTASGGVNFTVTATDSQGFTGSRAYTMTIAAPTMTLSPASGSLNASVGTAFSQTFSASGGTASYAYSLTVSSGSMPTGLSFNTATGALSGTPTTAGSVSFSVTATDSTTGAGAPFTVTSNYTLTTGAPVITVGPVALPGGMAAVAYNQTFTASGGVGPYTYTVTSGSLPVGLTLTGATVSGTPTATGNFNFTVTATDAAAFTSSRAYAITIAAPVIVLTPTTLPVPAVGILYHQTVTASGGNGSYTYSATGIMPTGLTLSPAGILSGTPGPLTAGQPYSITVRATDSTTGAGAPYSGTRVYSFTVAQGVPTATPVRVSTQPGVPVTIDAATGAAGAPFTGVAIVAPPASGSTAISGTAITYTPAANTAGEVTFDYTLSNATGPSTPVRVTVDVGVIPVALPQRPLTTVAGRSARIELTEGATGGPFTGAALISVSPAEAGTATITPTASNGYTLEFVPTATFGGAAVILYTLSNATTTSAPAQIMVTVTPRRDPSADPDVTGLINAQAQAARRFATTQISNYNQRLEALHGRGRASSQNNLSVVLPARQMDAYQRCAEIVGLRARNACLTGMEAGTHAEANVGTPAGTQMGTDAGMPARSGFLRTSYRPGTQPVGTFRTSATAPARSQGQGLPDLPGADSAVGSNMGMDSDLAFWSVGMLDFGFANTGPQRAGFRFTTGGVTAGADYRVSDQVSIGGGFGYARDSTDIGSAGTHSTGDSYSVALYGSFRPTPAVFIDGVAGLGTLSFDSRRWVSDANAFATGKRDGRQLFASVSAGYEYRDQAWLISPYGRLSVSETRLDRFSESGADYHALTYFDQTVTSLSGTLGLRTEYAQEVRWGMLLPFLRVEYQRDLNGESTARLAYADLAASGPFYAVRGSALGRDRMQIGLGAKLNTGTLSFGLDYSVMFGMGGLQQGVRVSFVAPF